MFGKKKDYSEVVSILSDKVSQLGEENGQLMANNAALQTQLTQHVKTILALKSDIRFLEDQSDRLIQAGSMFGINLNPVVSNTGSDGMWLTPALQLAKCYLKPRITRLTVPDYNAAKSVDELRDFLFRVPGHSTNGDGNAAEAEKQYRFLKVHVDQLLLKEGD